MIQESEILDIIKENFQTYFSMNKVRDIYLAKKHDIKLSRIPFLDSLSKEKRQTSGEISHVFANLSRKGFIKKHNKKFWMIINEQD